MNIYGAVLFVEYMKSTEGLVSVVRLSVSMLMLWFGVFGLAMCMGKAAKKIETDILMYLVVVVDHVSPVPST